MILLEKMIAEQEDRCVGFIEFDETYELESTKGSIPERRKARHRGEPASLRVISHKQVCIVTATDRNSHEIFKAVGLDQPANNLNEMTECLIKEVKRVSL